MGERCTSLVRRAPSHPRRLSRALRAIASWWVMALRARSATQSTKGRKWPSCPHLAWNIGCPSEHCAAPGRCLCQPSFRSCPSFACARIRSTIVVVLRMLPSHCLLDLNHHAIVAGETDRRSRWRFCPRRAAHASEFDITLISQRFAESRKKMCRNRANVRPTPGRIWSKLTGMHPNRSNSSRKWPTPRQIWSKSVKLSNSGRPDLADPKPSLAEGGRMKLPRIWRSSGANCGRNRAEFGPSSTEFGRTRRRSRLRLRAAERAIGAPHCKPMVGDHAHRDHRATEQELQEAPQRPQLHEHPRGVLLLKCGHGPHQRAHLRQGEVVEQGLVLVVARGEWVGEGRAGGPHPAASPRTTASLRLLCVSL